MRIGYACINLSVGCTSGKTFRLKSYSEERFLETVSLNLKCLQSILEYNARHGIYFFRITSNLIPFASHPVCTFDWRSHFRKRLRTIGRYAKNHEIRMTMHPGQYTLLNSPRSDVHERSVRELLYHVDVLNLLETPPSAKIQLHVGGVYKDKPRAIERFVRRYDDLDESLKQRLVIENDERSYSVQNCLEIHERTGVPVLVDTLHHAVKPAGLGIVEAINQARSSWRSVDGLQVIDYSTQDPEGRPGKHASTINLEQFSNFLAQSSSLDFDIMLEIKDKNLSALKAIEVSQTDSRTNN